MYIYKFVAPVSKRSKVNEPLDEADLWGDDLDLTPKVKPSLHGNKVTKPTEVVHYDTPLSPDQLIMEQILEYRNKKNVRELKVDKGPDRTTRLVDGR